MQYSRTDHGTELASVADHVPYTELLRTGDVLSLIPLSRTTLWRRRKAGEFPEPVRLGGPGSRVTAWRLSDIEAWVRDPEGWHQNDRDVA